MSSHAARARITTPVAVMIAFTKCQLPRSRHLRFPRRCPYFNLDVVDHFDAPLFCCPWQCAGFWIHVYAHDSNYTIHLSFDLMIEGTMASSDSSASGYPWWRWRVVEHTATWRFRRGEG